MLRGARCTRTGAFVGRKALITGGDSGIGRAVAIAYLAAEQPSRGSAVSTSS